MRRESPHVPVRYLWQLGEWPDLWWDAGAVLAVVAAARADQGRLLGRASALGMQGVPAGALAAEALGTGAIEGEAYDPVAVRSSVARRLDVPYAGAAASDRRVEGLLDVLMDATVRAGEPVTAERLHAWHASLFPTGRSGMRSIVVGAWRTGGAPMRVVSGPPDRERVHLEAPPSARVPAEMDALLRWLETDPEPAEPVVRAALAHLWFETVHPYDDGNGRLGRALVDLVLARSEGPVRLYSLSSRFLADRAGYYGALRDAQTGDGDITAWILWFARAVRDAVAEAEVGVDRALAATRFWARFGGVSLSERQEKAVRRLIEAGPDGFEGGISTRKYAALTRVSPATAQRDLADLVARGLLVPRAGGGRSTAYDLAWPSRRDVR